MQDTAKGLMSFKTRCLDVNFDLAGTDYKSIENIGTGAYGVVCSAINKKSGIKVAIKKIPNAFCEETIAKRTYREIRILRHFRHENVIAIRDILDVKEPVSDFKDVYVVLDLMESDLHQIIHSKQPFSAEHVRYFLYQILRGLKYIHSANVIHRDLKPSNLLINGNCELKIGDFGMARGVSSIPDPKRQMRMTNYVATRWYRAPELLFPMEHYMKSVDMWSVGCILAEMIGRKQIFPGRNLINQLTLVTEVLGLPPDSMIRSCHSEQIFTFFHKNYGHLKPIDLKTKYPQADLQALDLLSKMLKYRPEERVTAADALKHPHLAKYHDPLDEPLCFPQFDFTFENEKLNKDQIKEKGLKIIRKYHRHKKQMPRAALGSFMKPTARICGTINNQEAANVLQPGQFIPDKFSLLQKQQNAIESAIPDITDKGLSLEEGGGAKLNAPQINIQTIPHDSNSTVNVNESQGGLLVTTQQSTNDVEMKSASSMCGSAHINAVTCTNADGNNDIQKHTLLSQCSDVVMKSATREDPSHELPQQVKQVNDLQKLNSKTVPNDVAMRSAKCDGHAKNNKSMVVVGPTTKAVAECTQKTISTDTKALIKAALLNVALRNKMQAAQTDKSKGTPKAACIEGHRASVKAWERQKEREDKRKLKLKKLNERQKKLKAKTKEQENQGLFLTQEDRDMLKRWNKMRASAQESGEPGSINVKQSKPELKLNNSVKSTVMGQTPGNTHKPIVMPQGNTTNSQSGLQSTNLENDAANIQTTFVLAGQSQTQHGTPVHIKLAQPTTSFVLNSTSHFNTKSRVQVSQNLKPIAPKHQIRTTQNKNVPQRACLFNQVPMMSSDAGVPSQQPLSCSSFSNITESGKLLNFTPDDMLKDQLPKHERPFTLPADPVQHNKHSKSSTPSPTFLQHGSPPTYQEALEAKHRPPTKMSPLLRDEFLMSINSLGGATKVAAPDLFKDVAFPSGFYKDPNSPPDIAAVIHQFSKSGMVDVLPPILQLTPRGDGAGYGLTMDLEELLNQSLDMQPLLSAGRCESGPLSASLLSDWIELHNLDQADLQAVQQELNLSSTFTIATLPDVTGPNSKDKLY